MEHRLYTLNSSPVLADLVMPLAQVERDELEENIRQSGDTLGIRVWNTTILVDYDYYSYCHRFNIPFCLINVPIQSEAEAIIWVCKNQLERKFLTDERKKYLIGKLSLAERAHKLHTLRKVDLSPGRQGQSLIKLAYYNSLKTVVRGRVGKDYHLAYITVRKYETYATALDILRESCADFVYEHLAGRLKMSIERIESLSLLTAEERRRTCRRWLHEPVEIQLRQKRAKVTKKKHNHKKAAMPGTSIKDMPVYDPDAEMVSLIFTIPFWRRSINRVKEVADIDKASPEARLRLIEALMLLESTADRLIDVLKEEPNERL